MSLSVVRSSVSPPHAEVCQTQASSSQPCQVRPAPCIREGTKLYPQRNLQFLLPYLSDRLQFNPDFPHLFPYVERRRHQKKCESTCVPYPCLRHLFGSHMSCNRGCGSC